MGTETATDHIRITWYANGNPGLTATVYRRTESSDWAALGTVTADGIAYLHYEDDAVTPGMRYGYRLGFQDGGSEVYLGEVWAVAAAISFTLDGARPNPGTSGDLTVRFTLPMAAPARLELLDISGRRLLEREVGALGAGPHAVRLADQARIAPGVYLVRLSQGGAVRVARAVVLN